MSLAVIDRCVTCECTSEDGWDYLAVLQAYKMASEMQLRPAVWELIKENAILEGVSLINVLGILRVSVGQTRWAAA